MCGWPFDFCAFGGLMIEFIKRWFAEKRAKRNWLVNVKELAHGKPNEYMATYLDDFNHRRVKRTVLQGD